MVTAADPVEQVRDFNRFYTRVIGVLDEGLLRTRYSLTEARILFELGRGGTLDVADLRATLGLDAGYLSRILARFEADGLVGRDRSAQDGRRQVIGLTPRGRRAFGTLDGRSAADNRALLERLDEDGRDQLLSAMAALRAVLSPAGADPEVVLRAPAPGDFGWVISRHGAIYADEYGWDASFEALVARIVAAFATDHDPAREQAWIATVDGRRAGSVFCVRKSARVAQLRLLLVERWARGHGIGGRLVRECLEFARGAGYREIRLWTNDVLVDARRIYERAGFRLVESHPEPNFGAELVSQTWSRRL